MSHRHVAATFLALALLVPAATGAAVVEKGVKAGLNLARFRGDFADVAETKMKIGFVGGPFVAIGFAPDLAVQAEALFSMKGAKSSVTSTDEGGNPLGVYDTFWNLTYLEVPVLLRGTLLRGAPVQPMWYLGPTFGISLGGKVTTDPSATETDLTDLNALDIGVAIGGGAGFKAGPRRILAEIRYTTGFADVYHIAGNLESINNVFSLTLGFTF